MKWEIFVTLLLIVNNVKGYGEPDASGHPNWQERANHVYLNAVRIAPSQYKTVYMAGYSPSPSSILGTTYPARPPLYLEPKLVSSAYAHSNDMATHGCFAHDSCDGTPVFTRIASYYSCSGTMGENIAAGYADPLDTNNQWLCDEVDSACAADGSGNDGHRSNIMFSSYAVVGTGFAYNATSTYRNYWTQDFGGTACAPAPTSPVYGASHRVKSGVTRFIGVYYTSPAVAPTSANVVIGGTAYPLTLDIGASGAGTYFVEQTSGTACRSYYFTFGSVRYPDTGCLVTYGEGTCTTSFDATCGGTSSAAATSTSAVATTAKVTSASAASTTAKVTSSSTSTTAKVTSTTKSATVTTGSSSTTGGGTYYLYSTALQNSWTLQYNTGATVTNSYVYSGVTGLRADVTTSSSSNFVMFNHVPAVTNIWTTLHFNIAASASGTVWVFFNSGYYQVITVTTTWQAVSIPLTSLANPSTGSPFTQFGSPNQLVFSNAGTAAITLYLNNVALV